jgi:hypothetical protein
LNEGSNKKTDRNRIGHGREPFEKYKEDIKTEVKLNEEILSMWKENTMQRSKG